MKTVLILALSLLSVNAYAEDQLFTPYAGGFLGANSLKASNVGNETDKTGYTLGVKAVGSFDLDSFYVDGGLGWQYNKMSSSQVDVTTKSVFTEIDARYKMGSFSLGPIVSVNFGVDNTQDEKETNPASTMVSGGIKGVWQISKTFRVEANLQNSLSGTSERNNLQANVGVQFALPWFESKAAPTPAPKPVAKAVIPKEEVADVKVTLKSARVGFDTAAYKLDEDTTRKLTALGKYLSRNPELYGRIKISGHTDARGSREYNLALSQDRADSVMSVLVKNGVAENKVQARGFGFSRPLAEGDTLEAYEQNRRTEIEFFEVKDRARLNRALEQILK